MLGDVNKYHSLCIPVEYGSEILVIEPRSMKEWSKKNIVCLCILVLVIAIIGCGNDSEEIGLSSVETSHTVIQEAELTEENNENTSSEMEEGGDTISVYICGAVNTPGVYEFEVKDRVTHAIEKAGGFARDADTQFWNLAQLLSDGEKIYVPTIDQVKSGYISGDNSSEQGVASDGKININTATKEQLMTLTGVGEAKALSIISYRESNGNYTAIEDVMKISGIKDAVFNTIKDYITV